MPPDPMAIGLTLAAWTPMLIWFAAFRPGIMSADSLAHWREATQGGWADLHPPAYTALLWVSANVVDSPSLVTLAQSLFLAAAMVAVARALVRLGAPVTWTAVVTGALAVSPVVGALSVSVWKDIPYTAALLFATARLIDVLVARLRDDKPGCRRAVLACALWMAPATLLRQNGLLFAVPLLLLVLATTPEVRRRCAVLLLVLVALVVSFKGLVFPAAGIEPSPPFATLATFSHDIAAVATAEPTSFGRQERALLGRVAPFLVWRKHYPAFGCTSLNWVFAPGFDWEEAAGVESRYLRLWIDLLATHPGQVVGNRMCVASIAWRPDQVGALYTVSRGIDPNDLGLRTAPVSDDVNRLGHSLLDASERLPWLLWRAPLWIYGSYLLIGAAAWRTKQHLLLLAVVPLLAQQLSVIPLNPAQDARYMMFSLIYAPMLLPLGWSLLRRDRSFAEGGEVRPTPDGSGL